jgi:hypothetical protein
VARPNISPEGKKMSKNEKTTSQNDNPNPNLEEQVRQDVAAGGAPTMRQRLKGAASSVVARLGNVAALLAAAGVGGAAVFTTLVLLDDSPKVEGVRADYARDALVELADDVLDDTMDEVEDNVENGLDNIEDNLLGVIAREKDDEDRAEAVADFIDEKMERLINGARDRAKGLVKTRVAEARVNLKGPWYDRALAWISGLR